MTKFWFWGIRVLLASLLTSCNPDPYQITDLAGEWQAISLTEEGDSLAVNFSEIKFDFDEVGNYTFNSTLNYKEAGTFYLDGPYLFSTDTSREFQQEKVVKIVSLNADSLQLEMKEMGKQRILWLVK